MPKPLTRNISGLKGWAEFSHGVDRVSRTAFLNHLAFVYGYEDYLEIGVRNKASNLTKINVKNRVGVDPNPAAKADFVTTSDIYFEKYNQGKKFDLIFIDGLHLGEQVIKDLTNSLKALKPGGAILMHDTNPPTAFHAREEYEVDGKFPSWNGTTWQAFAYFRAIEPNLSMHCIDADWGCGLIQTGHQIVYPKIVTDYQEMDADRKALLKLISIDEFLAMHPAKPISKFDKFARVIELELKSRMSK